MHASGPPLQPEFDFKSTLPKNVPFPRDGLACWRGEREQATHALAIKLGLPIGHPVEVLLKDGVVLRGKLRVGEVLSDLEKFDRNKVAMQVESVIFFFSEIESCVRL